MTFAGAAALITGAGSGIGQAIARAFAHAGASVLVADVEAAAGEETVRLIVAEGGRGVFRRVDVTEAQDVQTMIQDCIERFGRLDILCNNAGVGVAAKCHETREEDLDRILATNVRGTFLGCKYAISVFLDQGGGIIINTASVAGLVGVRDRAAYCASKAAIVGLTKSLAVDYARDNIRVNAICPGTVETPWVARINAHLGDYETIREQMNARQLLGRMGTPEEIAAAALYLASPEASFVHGSCFIIDGGLTAM
ncbi:MAG: glucose 1-dehydrogenase [Actinobacteria bacterium]|nr:glucose 1-dehydrogenase [Actinomycetota bacterium]